jgi:hypothetical protein
MITFPTFQSLDVENYGLYPGADDSTGLHIKFDAGLTLIMGANGLGKTTLITLLYRMCTGPYELSGLLGAPTLGGTSLKATRLQRWDQRVFASRVADDAEIATARLTIAFGERQLAITRNMSNLAVADLTLDGEELQSSDDAFQDAICELTSIATFGEWILLLRYLVFYFEQRRALVWDPTAQRQILRVLLLPPDAAAGWAEAERAVLELDSRFRNLRATLNREEGVERRARAKVARGPELHEEIQKLERDLSASVASLESLSEFLIGSEAERQRARIHALTLEQAIDGTWRALERLELERITAEFPDADETSLYLYSRLITSGICATCGNEVPDVAERLMAAVRDSLCVVCGRPRKSGKASTRKVNSHIADLTTRYDELAVALQAALAARDEAVASHARSVAEFNRLDVLVAQQRGQLASLIRRLPPADRVIREQSAEVSVLRGRLNRLSEDLDEVRASFETLVKQDSLIIAKNRAQIIEVFTGFAKGFLFEESQLRWAPNRSRVGQSGPLLDFPAFEFEMGGADFPTPVRRTAPEQVSESQREFVDLAFRMTLMSVAGVGEIGSLIIDAPEASLDAVFSERAADVLVRFANRGQNRLIVTSNLVDGQLIPRMLRDSGIPSAQDPRYVDLLEVAAPTAAIRELAQEYRDVRDNLFTDAANES